MAGWADNIFSNLPPGKPLPGSPRRPKLPDNTPLFPVDPRTVVGGLMDQGAQGVGHAIDYATGQPVGEGFSQPTLGREAYQMLTSPTFGGGVSPMAGASTLAVAPLAARAAQASRGARTAEEVATGARTAATDADAAAQVQRAAQASPGQAALDQMVSGSQAAPTAAPSATQIATGGGRALTDIAPDIRNMPVDQGIAQARTEQHLVPAGNVGRSGYIGGPPDVQTYEDLVQRRAQVDAYIDQHLGGADWYDRSRAGTNEATGGDPQMNRWMTALHGSMSAGVSPASETAFALRESGSRVAGEPMRGQYQNASDAFSRAIDANDPSLMQGGPKTLEYASHVNPNQPSYAPTATGVNDFRYGNLWGYRPADAEMREGELSFGAPQHRWLDYETALAADRANQRQLGGRTDWTGEQIQAVPWVTQKSEDLGIPFEEANKTAPDFYPNYQVSATFEAQPGRRLAESGHLPGSVDMTPEQREAYANAPGSDWTDPTGRDVIYGGGRVGDTGVGVPTLPTLTGTGRYGDETNPQRIARPIVPMRTSSAADRMPDVPLGTKDLYPYTTNFLNTGEYIRTLMDANEMGGWTKTIDKQPPGATNSVFVPLARDAKPEEMDALAKAGEPFGLPHVNSTAGGLTVQNFDGAPTLKPKQRNALIDAIGDAAPDDAGDPRMVRSVTGSATPAYTTPGAFTATEALLGPDYMGRNPATWDFFANNKGIGSVAGQLAQRDASLPSEIGQQGQDFWNLRMLAAADPGSDGLTWADRLKSAVQQRAVPASVTVGGSTVALYPTAGLPATPPQQQTPGMSLNSLPPPDWLRQYYGGGL